MKMLFTYKMHDKTDKAVIGFHRILGWTERARNNRDAGTIEEKLQDYNNLLEYINRLEAEWKTVQP